MADLSKLAGRKASQERITNNRDVIIPRSRITELDRVQPVADILSAARGNVSDELNRFLGNVGGGLQSIGKDIMDNRNEAASAKGAIDGVTGQFDANSKSDAYARGYYSANAVATQSRWEVEDQTALQNAANDPNVSVDELHTMARASLDARLKAIKDSYPDPTVQAQAVQSVVSYAARSDAALNAVIKKRTDAQYLKDTSDALVIDLRAGGRPDVAAKKADLIAHGVPVEEIDKAIADALTEVVLDPDSPQPELASQYAKAQRTKPDGTKEFVFSTQQRAAFQIAARQAQTLADQKEKDDQEEAVMAFVDGAVASGNRNYMPDLIKLRDAGKITDTQFVETNSLLTRSFSAAEEGFVNQAEVDRINAMFATLTPNFPAIISAVSKANFGVGLAAERERTGVLAKAFAGRRADIAEAKADARARDADPDAKSAKAQRKDRVSAAGTYLQSALSERKPRNAGEVRAQEETILGFKSDMRAKPDADPWEVADKHIKLWSARHPAARPIPTGQQTATPNAGKRRVYDPTTGGFK